MMRIPFQERKTRFRGLLDLVTGAYPAFCFGGPLGRGVPVFHFHDVTTDYLEPYLRHLAENGYRTMTSAGLGRCVCDGDLPDEPTVVLCFDDAWASLGDVVVPLLKQYGLTAIAYVVPGRVQERPGGPLASWNQLEEVRDSGVVDIQAHTYSHAMMFCDDRISGFVEPQLQMTYLSRPVLEFGYAPRFLSPEMLGVPLYACRSRMSDARWYRVDPEQRDACMAHVRSAGGERFFDAADWYSELKRLASDGAGAFETVEEQRDAVLAELTSAREAIASRLALSSIRQVCMPWGICGKLAGSLVSEAGYETAIADRLYGRRIITGQQDPFRIMRLKHRYILRLPRK